MRTSSKTFYKLLLPSITGRAGQGRAGQGRAGQGRAGQGKAGQGRAGQGSDAVRVSKIRVGPFKGLLLLMVITFSATVSTSLSI